MTRVLEQLRREPLIFGADDLHWDVTDSIRWIGTGDGGVT
jgi:hypothetical protein